MKAGIHYAVGRLCEEVSTDLEVTFNKQVIATLSEIVNKQISTYTLDLEAFSK